MLQKAYVNLLLTVALLPASVHAQLVINEASGRNARTLPDAAGEYHDWIEIHNAGNTAADLTSHTLSDDPLDPLKWTFPAVSIPANGHLIVFCSGDDRGPREGMTHVAEFDDFVPVEGWNTHQLSAPLEWDGTANLIIQLCALRGDMGGFLNAVFNQTTTPFASSANVFSHDPSRTCGMAFGDLSHRRPVMRLNGATIGTPDWLNAFVQLPAPYANWQGGAKQAYFLRADELTAAGLTAGPITSIAFDVLATYGAALEELDIHMALTSETELSATFKPTTPSNELHTNFRLGRNGETVHLYAPGAVLIDSLAVLQNSPDHSNGRSTDGGADDRIFTTPTPGTSNNGSTAYNGYTTAPIIDAASALAAQPVVVTIYDTNPPPSTVRFTLDGTEPDASSPIYTGPLTITSASVLKARAFSPGKAPSVVAAASYLVGVQHTTAVISVITPPDGLDGPQGIFTNWQRDDEVQAHVDFFRPSGQLVVSQSTGMQVDGGLGGSRGFPQHSFRLEFDNDALGDGRVNVPLIPDRPARTRYSRIYLRNGSNQYQILPHKDAVQVKMMAGETHSYYAAWTPATVYINGAYFGLYELREKFDDEYFRTLENADADSVDLLSLSAWNGTVLRPTEGSVDPFWRDISSFYLLDPEQEDFWAIADARFDLTWYTDHIIGQQWMGTRDWPGNNIKIQRSNATDFKWRFCTIDLELALAPNGQSDAAFDAVTYTAQQPTDIPYSRIWQRAIENPRFHDHFINRFADVMNSAYLNERLLGIAQDAYDLTRPEMGLQFQRWSSADTATSLAQYEANHEAFLNDLEQRTPFVRTHIQDFFALPRQVDVTLDVVPAGAGSIRISTLHPDTYPWEGVYFDGVPIRIEAVANPGYFFTHWTPEPLLNNMMDPVFLDTLTANTAFFQANFIPDLPTAVQANDAARLSVAPNPTTGELTIDTALLTDGGELTYTVFDARGQQVLEGTLTGAGRSTIQLHGLVTGPYQLQVTNVSGRRANTRFVKW